MILLDQGRTVTAPLEQGSVGVPGQVSGDVVSRPLSGMQGRLDGLTSGKVSQPGVGTTGVSVSFIKSKKRL